MANRNGDDNATAMDTTTTAEVGTLRPADQFRAYMLERAQRNAANAGNRGREVMSNQLDRIIMAAESDDDDALWDADMGGAIQGRDIAGLWVRIHDFDSVISTRTFDDEDGGGNPNGWYAQMNSTVLGGDKAVLDRNGLKVGADFVLQTGAELIAGKARAWEAQGKLPRDAMIVANTTASGNDVLKLGRIPEHVTVNATAE